MQVILLERIENLGQMGETVNVRNGYARNYLLPQKKALRATEQNVLHFEGLRAQLEASNLKKKKEAEKMAAQISGTEIIVIRQASETGQLYGSVRNHDIREGLREANIMVEKSQIMLSAPLKNIGIFPVRIKLHPEVDATISINIAKSDEEAGDQRPAEEIFAAEAVTPAAEETAETLEAKPAKAKKAAKPRKTKAKAKAADESSEESTGE